MIHFEKAFDSISWLFLHRALEAFNFGPYFFELDKILYSNPQCCVTNNGYSSLVELDKAVQYLLCPSC